MCWESLGLLWDLGHLSCKHCQNGEGMTQCPRPGVLARGRWTNTPFYVVVMLVRTSAAAAWEGEPSASHCDTVLAMPVLIGGPIVYRLRVEAMEPAYRWEKMRDSSWGLRHCAVYASPHKGGGRLGSCSKNLELHGLWGSRITCN